MYLHLGQDTVVRTDSILGVFDLDNATVSQHTKDFLSRAQKEGRVVNVSFELPRSFIVCEKNGEQTVYISQLSSATLLKRGRAGLTESN